MPNQSDDPDKTLEAEPARSEENQSDLTLSPRQDPMIGRHLDGGKYTVISVLGRGGIGIVYKAQQELVGRYVAIKTLAVQLVGDPTIVRRFTREIQALGKLSHPNIVTAFDCVLDTDGQPYFIMDYLEGISLAQLLDSEFRLKQDRVRRMFIQVCSAVGCAHNQKVVHRDLKPGNIMLINAGTEDEQVKIVDFGLAKITEEVSKLTATGEIWGTPLYMSPEQAHGQLNDHRSDIYSIGCVMYEALTGLPPFAGNSAMETLMMQINKDAPPFETASPGLNIHPALEFIVQKALQKDPTMRWQTMSEMEKALKELNLEQALPPAPVGGWGVSNAANSTVPVSYPQGRPPASGNVEPAAQNPPAPAPPPTPPAPPVQVGTTAGAGTGLAPSSTQAGAVAPQAVPPAQTVAVPKSVLIALAAVALMVVAGSLVWFLKPSNNTTPTVNQTSTSTQTSTTTTSQPTAAQPQTATNTTTSSTSGPTTDTSTKSPDNGAATDNSGTETATEGTTDHAPDAGDSAEEKIARPLNSLPHAHGTASNGMSPQAAERPSVAQVADHHVKHPKHHHSTPAHSGSAQPSTAPLDDTDRWERFNSGH